MDDFILKFLNICIVCLIGYLIYLVGDAIYLKIIDHKTTIHVESGVVIDKYEGETKIPITIGNTIIFNSYRHLYLLVKTNYKKYEVEVYSHKYDIGDEVQLQIKEYKNKVISYKIL